MVEFGGGGLKRSVCQFVDCIFCQEKKVRLALERRNVGSSIKEMNLEVVSARRVVLVDSLREHDKRVTNK